MEDPVAQIPEVISLLVQSPPTVQRQTIEKFFTPDASFTHPFCRTGSWDGSRGVIILIYQWYKIMSPKIEVEVKSVAFDADNLILYVTFSQVFRVWVIPFYKADVTGTTVLHLTTKVPSSSSSSSSAPSRRPPPAFPPIHSLLSEKRYWITSQNDLYQTTDFVKFLSPARILYASLVLWQYAATVFCVMGAFVLWPITWMEDNTMVRKRAREIEIEMIDHSKDQ